jgi:hypothetical protein
MTSMTLMTAHRILIGAAVAFFAFYGLWEFAGTRVGRGTGGTFRGVLGLLAAFVLLIYLRTLIRGRHTRSGADPEGGDQ